MPEQPLKKMTQALAETADMSLLRVKQKNGLIKNLMKKNKAKITQYFRAGIMRPIDSVNNIIKLPRRNPSRKI
jgi:hypothetical protein